MGGPPPVHTQHNTPSQEGIQPETNMVESEVSTTAGDPDFSDDDSEPRSKDGAEMLEELRASASSVCMGIEEEDSVSLQVLALVDILSDTPRCSILDHLPSATASSEHVATALGAPKAFDLSVPLEW